MPEFRNREEYEKWKAQKIKENEEKRKKAEEIKDSEKITLQEDQQNLLQSFFHNQQNQGMNKEKKAVNGKEDSWHSWQMDLFLSVVGGIFSIYKFNTGQKWGELFSAFFAFGDL